MSISDRLKGTARVRIISADKTHFLNILNASGIVLNDLESINELVVEATINISQLEHLECLAETKGVSIEVQKFSGIHLAFKQLFHRPVLILGFILYTLVVLYLPGKVLFVCVEGNTTIPAGVIVEKAEDAGLYFGANRKTVRSEHIKNILLTAMPELQWAGVNTKGCVATISVVEKTQPDDRSDSAKNCNIVASTDGVIDAITVIRGTQLCRVGQAVKAGDVLVSGYTDGANTIKLIGTQAEVYAKTIHQSKAVIALARECRTTVTRKKTNYSLIFRKKEIKLQKDSGISSSRCVKMYSKYTLTLPGGFQLPFSIVKETIIDYETEQSITSETSAAELAQTGTLQYLQEKMVAGKVLSSVVDYDCNNDVFVLYGKHLCREMISKVYEEEIIIGNE